MKRVYGPIDSWRLGASLGVDLISTEGRTCSFDCNYCQIEDLLELTVERRKFVEITEVREELVEALEKVGDHTDYITLSGVGEPTLTSNLDEGVNMLNEVSEKPKAILTNGSLFSLKEVRDALQGIDYVIAQLDAPNEKVFREINRPVDGIRFQDLLEGYEKFREEYGGRFALEMMFTERNKDLGKEMAGIADDLGVDEIQLNTPLRSSMESSLDEETMMKKIEKDFKGLKADVRMVYREKRKGTEVLDSKEVIKRGRPVKKG